MKRIDRPTATQFETRRSENKLADNVAAATVDAATANAWADAWSQQLNKSGEIYGRLFAGMRDEFAGFMQKRLEANMEAARAWTTCRSVNEALDLQQSWLRCAIEQYSDESTKVSELCRGAVFQGEPENGASEELKPAAERRHAHEPMHSHVRRAAE